MSKIVGVTVGTNMPRSDFKQSNSRKADYIKNKPTLGALAAKDEVAKTDLATGVQESLDSIDNIALVVDTLYSIVTDTVVVVDTVTDTYSERTAAGEIDVVDKTPTIVKKIQGSTEWEAPSANLLNLEKHFEYGSSAAGITCTDVDNNTITFSGNIASGYDGYRSFGFFTVDGLEVGKTYTLSQTPGIGTLGSPCPSILVNGANASAEGSTFAYEQGMSFELALIGQYEVGTPVNCTISFMLNAGDTALDYEPYRGTGKLVNAKFAGIACETADGAERDSMAMDAPVELACGDYIDVENQQLVRQTRTLTLTSANAWGQQGSSSVFYFNLPSGYHAGAGKAVSAMTRGFKASAYDSMSSMANAKEDYTYTITLSSQRIVVSCSEAANPTQWGNLLNKWKNEGNPLQIVYQATSPLSTENIVCPDEYKVFEGGREYILPEGETVTVTQDYYVKVGGDGV